MMDTHSPQLMLLPNLHLLFESALQRLKQIGTDRLTSALKHQIKETEDLKVEWVAQQCEKVGARETEAELIMELPSEQLTE